MHDALFTANVQERTVEGLLLPFNELSAPNITNTPSCMFTAATALELPTDPSIATLYDNDHDRHKPRGRGVEFRATEDGIVAKFSIGKTPEGDALLARATDPTKPKLRLSAEVANLVIKGAHAVAGAITGATITGPRGGAFASAALFSIAPEGGTLSLDDLTPEARAALVAEAAQSLADDVESLAEANVLDAQLDAENQTPESTPVESDNAEDSAPTQEDNVTGTPAVVPGTLPVTPVVTEEPKKEVAMFAAATIQPVLRRVAASQATMADINLVHQFFAHESALFALSDLDYDGTDGLGAKMIQPQWLGENRGPDYIERFTPLFRQDTLRSLALGGFRWGTKPAGATWAGNKAAISSNAATVVAETETATRWAGGHDIAREHKDFQTPGFFESYEYWMRRSFLEWLDTLVLTEALAGATDIEADNPAGYDIGPAMSALIDGAAAVINAGYTPTFATMDTAYWKTIAKTVQDNGLAYLNAQLSLRVDGDQSLDSFKIVPAPVGTVTSQHVVVGSQDAATVFKLPGSPIRAEALNIANGGLDIGFFGYGAYKIENALALVDVAPYTP